MRRWLFLSYCLLIAGALCLGAQAQMLPLLGSGATKVAAATGYTGPGDCSGCFTSNIIAWGGLRAFTAASAGTKAANICNSGDANCADVNSLAGGDFDVATAQGAPLNCGGAGGTCTVKTLYDKSGALFCSGSVACDLANPAAATRPTLTFSATGRSKACMTLTAASVQFIESLVGLGSAVNQTFSMATYSKRTTTSGFQFLVIDTTSGNGIIYGIGANLAGMFAGSFGTVTASDNAFHSIAVAANSASSVVTIDGTNTTTDVGTGGLGSGNKIGIGQSGSGNPPAAVICEFQIVQTHAFSNAEANALGTNQTNYY